MARVRENFTTQVESALLAEIRVLAKHEGRQLESVVEDALRTYVEKHSRPRHRVMDAYRLSLGRYGALMRSSPNEPTCASR